MEGGLLLDVVVRQSPAVFQLFSSKDQPLLVWRDSFLILDLSFNILDGVRRFNLEGDSLTGQRLHKDLHTSSKPENKMEGGLLLDVIIGERPSILQLFCNLILTKFLKTILDLSWVKSYNRNDPPIL